MSCGVVYLRVSARFLRLSLFLPDSHKRLSEEDMNLLVKRFKQAQTPSSSSTPFTIPALGQAVRLVRDREEFNDDLADFEGPAVFTREMCASDFDDDEYRFNAFMTQHLQQVAPPGCVLVNTELWTWLKQLGPLHLTVQEQHDLKPDFVFIGPSFYIERIPNQADSTLLAMRANLESEGVVFRFGVPAEWEPLRDELCPAEGKLSLNDEARGKMVVYLTSICRGRLGATCRGIVYDPKGFELLSCDQGGVVARLVGKWIQPGSQKAVRDFLGVMSHHAPFTTAVRQFCEKKGYEMTECGFLGAGATGRVVSAMDLATGSQIALKIVGPRDVPALKAEYEKNRLVTGKVSGVVVPAQALSVSQSKTPMAIMEMPLCTSLLRRLRAIRDSGKCGHRAPIVRNILKDVFLLMLKLHTAGFVHGDPRLENTVLLKDDSNPCFIDLLGSDSTPILSNFRRDLDILIASVESFLSTEYSKSEKAQSYIAGYAESCSCGQFGDAKTNMDGIVSFVVYGPSSLLFVPPKRCEEARGSGSANADARANELERDSNFSSRLTLNSLPDFAFWKQ